MYASRPQRFQDCRDAIISLSVSIPASGSQPRFISHSSSHQRSPSGNNPKCFGLALRAPSLSSQCQSSIAENQIRRLGGVAMTSSGIRSGGLADSGSGELGSGSVSARRSSAAGRTSCRCFAALDCISGFHGRSRWSGQIVWPDLCQPRCPSGSTQRIPKGDSFGKNPDLHRAMLR